MNVLKLTSTFLSLSDATTANFSVTEKNNCRNSTPTCSFCGIKGHTQGECENSSPKCINCSGSHAADSKQCPRWLSDCQIQRIKSQTGVSFAEARRIHAGNNQTSSNNNRNNNTGASGTSINRTTVLESFPQHIILESTQSDNQLTKLSPFVVSKALQAAVRTLSGVKRLQNGTILVSTDNLSYSRKLLDMTNLHGVPIKASPHRTLNHSKGIIRCAQLKTCTTDEIVEELKSQGVTHCFNPSTRDSSKTNTFILTFSSTQPTKHLSVGFLHVSLEKYIPNPIRCFRCQKFGHGTKTCRREITCARCGDTGHDHKNCQNPVKCANCGEHHEVF